MKKILAVVLTSFGVANYAMADTYPGTEVQVVKKGVKNAHEAQTPKWAYQIKDENKQARSSLFQAPLIPHSITGMQISKNVNRCMDCHSKEGSEVTGATPPSKTHYVGRDDLSSGTISPRRHFCVQCHVPQDTSVDGIKLITENEFTPNKGFNTEADEAKLPQITRTPGYDKLQEETLEMFKHSSESYLHQHH